MNKKRFKKSAFGKIYFKALFQILTFEIDFTKRRFLESFFIHNSENSINDTENCFYSEIYDNLT